MKSKKRRKLILFLLGLTVIIGAACYTLFIQPSLNEDYYEYKETQIQFGDLVQGITESGSIDFVTESLDYELDFDFSDDEDEDDEDEEENSGYLRIEEIYIANGQRIKAGDAVLKFTDKSMANLRQKLKSAKSEAEIALEEARTDYELNALSARQTYDSNILDGSSAESIYTLTTVSLQKEIEQAQAQVSIWETEIRQIEKELDDTWEDFDELEEEYEDALYEFNHTHEEASVTKYITAREEYLSIKERYESARDERLEQREKMVELQEDIDNQALIINAMLQKLERRNLDAKQSYEVSSLNGELAEGIYNYSLDSLAETVRQGQEDLEAARKDLEDFEEFVQDGILYAGEDGLITGIAYEEGDYLITEGPLFSYVKDGNYIITIDIAEEDIPYVYVGEEVNIEFSAYPDEYYEGIITEITTSSSRQSSTTVSYPVTIEISGDTDKLYGGMTGDITFITEEAQEVLYVSKKAIVKEEGKFYVYQKREDGEYELFEVETGFSDGINIQIVSGLEEGETVYIASLIAAEDKKEEETRQSDTMNSQEGMELPEGMKAPADMDMKGPSEGGASILEERGN